MATEAAWRLDFEPEALEHARRWFELATAEHDGIDAQRYIGRLLLELADRPGADAVVEQLATDAARYEHLGMIAEQARAEAAVAQLVMLRHDPAAIDWAERAIEHARAAGDRAVEVQAKVERASAILAARTSREEALAALQDAAADAASLGDGVSRARAINNMLDMLPPAAPETAALRRELHDTASAIGLDKLGATNVVWWDAVAADRRRATSPSSGASSMCGRRSNRRSIAAPTSTARPSGSRSRRVASAPMLAPRCRSRTAPGINCADVHSIGTLAKQLAIAGLERDVDTATSTVWQAMCAGDLLPDGWGCRRSWPMVWRVRSRPAWRPTSARGVRRSATRRPSLGGQGPHDERGIRPGGRTPLRRGGGGVAASARDSGPRRHPSCRG